MLKIKTNQKEIKKEIKIEKLSDSVFENCARAIRLGMIKVERGKNARPKN